MTSNHVSHEDIVHFLNSLLEVDHDAMRRLLFSRVHCNKAMVDHPQVTVSLEEGSPQIGILGILNGLLGINNLDNPPKIRAVIDKDRIINFYLHKPEETKPCS